MTERKLPPTGYWMFVCNRTKWSVDSFLRSGKSELLYKISKHNRSEIRLGDLGVVRANAVKGTRERVALLVTVCALVEVIGKPVLAADSAADFYIDKLSASEIAWRVPIRIVRNLVDDQLIVQDFPNEDEFRYLRKALPTSTIPISKEAFDWVFRKANGVEIFSDNECELAQSSDGIIEIETNYAVDPKVRERRSKYIERGKFGAAVKKAREYKCQICESCGVQSVAFIKKNGVPYAEAHHVYPVSKLLPGTLSPLNIMVLCPNHHREVHYGDFEIVENTDLLWKVALGARVFEVSKLSISEVRKYL